MDGLPGHLETSPGPAAGLDYAVSQLHRSVRRGRAMTWPNFRRLVQRVTDGDAQLGGDQLRTVYELARRRSGEWGVSG